MAGISMMTKQQALIRRLLDWYDRNSRPLPWRETAEPYRIWVAEIMLQQTQVATVLPYYRNFLDRFPTVNALAAAPLAEVLKVWEGLGYYTRARHLHDAACLVAERYQGRLPDNRKALLALPGIGAYTVGAILSMAFGQPVAAVDGNVRRVWSRVFAVTDSRMDGSVQESLTDLAERMVSREAPGRFNQALMDLGATVCTPRNPRCALCPVRADCAAHAGGVQHVLPVVKKKPPVPERESVAAIITDEAGRLLIVQRLPDGLLGSLWKFPGGFSRPGEEPETSLQRTVHEELGVRIRVDDKIGIAKQVYTHFRLTLHAFSCRIIRGRPRVLACQDWAWTSREGLTERPFSGVDRKVMAMLTALV